MSSIFAMEARARATYLRDCSEVRWGYCLSRRSANAHRISGIMIGRVALLPVSKLVRLILLSHSAQSLTSTRTL